MSRLIVTFEAAAAGALKGAGLADHVVAFGWRFVWGPLPSSGELANEARFDGFGLIEFCQGFDSIELWADPEPNAQLQLVWLLDHLRSHSNLLARLALLQPSTAIGNHPSSEWESHRSRAVPIHSDHVEIASASWSAWHASTPAVWFDLLAQDLSALPALRNAVVALLEELPMTSAATIPSIAGGVAPN